jgi:hypothetical protein
MSTIATNTNTSTLTKPSYRDHDNLIVHYLVTGINVFIIVFLVLGLIAFFVYSPYEEAFTVRSIFFPKTELVPKVSFY